MRAPFPYPGGKRLVAAEFWRRIGHVSLYVDPFCGSLAVPLERPAGLECAELLGDRNALLVNAWRSIRWFPSETAELFRPAARRKRPHVDRGSRGVMRFRLATRGGRGALRFGRGGPCHDGRRGVFKVRTYHPGTGALSRKAELVDWFAQLQYRFRNARILCRDFEELLRESITTNRYSRIGVLLDPPYGVRARREHLYDEDSYQVAEGARAWAVERGADPRYRIALCGVQGEHPMPDAWSELRWRRSSGMGHKTMEESIWFSPHCLRPADARSRRPGPPDDWYKVESGLWAPGGIC